MKPSLGAVFLEAMQTLSQLQPEQRQPTLERILRDVWPQTREWKYLCQGCSDYGLEMFTCLGDRTCGRDKEHAVHEFGKPCWCSAGAKFRKAPASEQDFQAAGKTPKKQLTRFGR